LLPGGRAEDPAVHGPGPRPPAGLHGEDPALAVSRPGAARCADRLPAPRTGRPRLHGRRLAGSAVRRHPADAGFGEDARGSQRGYRRPGANGGAVLMKAMGDLGNKGIDDVLGALASSGDPGAAGVASAITAAAAAGLVELAAGLAARRIAGENSGEDAQRMRELAEQAGKLRATLVTYGEEDARACARVAKARQGREQSRARAGAGDPPVAIAEAAAAVAERAAEVAGSGRWAFTADAVVAGELAAAAARGCAQIVE